MNQAKSVNQLVELLFTTGQLIRERTKPSEKLSLASFAQLHIMQFIAMADNKKPINMSDVANYLNITPPSATSLVNNLVKNKELKRVPDTNDRRVVRLILTQSGLKTLARGRARLIKKVKEVLGVLSHKEQNQMVAILQKISKQYKI